MERMGRQSSTTTTTVLRPYNCHSLFREFISLRLFLYAISSWRCVWDTRALYFISPDFEIYSSKEAGASFSTHISFFVEFSPKKEKIRRCKLHLTLSLLGALYLEFHPYVCVPSFSFWKELMTLFSIWLLPPPPPPLDYYYLFMLPDYIRLCVCLCVYTHTHTHTDEWMDEPKWVFFFYPISHPFLNLYS